VHSQNKATLCATRHTPHTTPVCVVLPLDDKGPVCVCRAPPPIVAKSEPLAHPIPFLFWALLSRFFGVCGKGSPKTPQFFFPFYKGHKADVTSGFPRFFYRGFECFSARARGVPKHDHRGLFFDFFCSIAFSGVFQRWEFKNTIKQMSSNKNLTPVLFRPQTNPPTTGDGGPRFFLGAAP
jgi:hypothetical protein